MVLRGGDHGAKLAAERKFRQKEGLIPWELMYDEDGNPTRVERFWGMEKVLARSIVLKSGSIAGPYLPTHPKLGLITCKDLDAVREHEAPMFDRLHDSRAIALDTLGKLDPGVRDTGLERFGSFLKRKRDIIHFACHAFPADGLKSSLRIDDQFDISQRHFEAREYCLGGDPVVFLNACRTSVTEPLTTFNWASQFLTRNARGVLATEFRVPDYVASAFAKDFYLAFVKGSTIGRAVRAARVNGWRKRGDPLGLAYALYGSPMIQLRSV